MGKHTLPLLGAGLAALTAAATGAVYNIAFHTPNRTQNDDFSVVKTKKIAPIYDDILTLIRTMNSIPYEPVYITSHDGLRLRVLDLECGETFTIKPVRTRKAGPSSDGLRPVRCLVQTETILIETAPGVVIVTHLETGRQYAIPFP